MFFLVLLCIYFTSNGAVLGDELCDTVTPYENCVHFVPKEKLNAIDVVPNKEELMEICPGELKYFKCFDDYLDDCGTMGNHYSVVEFMRNAYDIAQDLCNEDSSLHKAYVASAECYKTLEGIGDACGDDSRDIYETYMEFLKKEHTDRLEAIERSSHRMCMIQSYKMACLSEKVLAACGEEANSSMMQIVSRTKYLRQFCSQSLVDELKTAFIDSLTLEEESRDIFASAFNLIKK